MTLHDCTMGCREIDCPKLSTLTTKFLDLRLLSASALARPIVEPRPRATTQSALHPTSFSMTRSVTSTGVCMTASVESWTPNSPRAASTHQTFAAGSFSFEDERWRFNVLVEGLCRVRKAALGVGTVVELHRDIEHHKIRGGHASTSPALVQTPLPALRPRRPPPQFPGHSVP